MTDDPTRLGRSGTADRTARRRARVRDLLGRMTLEEKLAQLVGFWEKEDGEAVAPLQGEFGGVADARRVLPARARPPHPRLRHPAGRRRSSARPWLWEFQRELVTGTRLGIPAIVHEECLTGLAAWKAATFPTPLAWGAAFDPELVDEMGAAIGASMRALGIHQGLAPVLDVIRDPRWGRVEECIAEDPYLVGTIGTSYVRGLQSQGVHATLKHFVGYSASRAGRNFAPVHAGPRELADVLLVPFEMAVLDGGARSVMHSYAEIDGVPVAADPTLLTGVLRDRWGFDGTVVGRLLRGGVPAPAAPRRGRPRRGRGAGAGRRRRHRAADRRRLPGAAGRGGAGRHASTRRWSTARCCGSCARSRSWVCSTRPSTTSRRPASTSTRPSTARSPAGSPRSRWCCSPTTACCRCRAGPTGGRHRPERRPAEALFGCYSFVNHVLAAASRRRDRASTCRPCSRRCGPSSAPIASPGARAAAVDDDDRSGFDEARRRGRRGRRRRPRRGRPRRPLRPRHRRRGLRPRRPGAAGRPARAGRGGAGHRHAGRAGAAHRPAVRGRLGAAAVRGGGAGVLPRRGGRRARSPACSPGGSTRPGGCRSACPARPVRSRTPTCTRPSARATR